MVFEGHTGNITGVAFHVECKWMVTSSRMAQSRFGMSEPAASSKATAHGAPVNDVVIHPNQGEIISCDRAGSDRLWDLAEKPMLTRSRAGWRGLCVKRDGW